MIWLCIIIFLLGVSFGCLVSDVTTKTKVKGCLRVDSSDPDEPPYIFLELEENPEVLKRKKFITLEVNLENYISQK